MRRHAGDLIALGTVLLLGVLFYYPETDPLQSRYIYYADSFERAARHVNPEYVDSYRRYDWESYSPLMTLLARGALLSFPDKPAAAVTVLYFGVALVAGVLTYLATRYYFSALPALFITALLMYDRALMPLARGLGMMVVLLLTPLLLIFIRNLARTQERQVGWSRRIVPVALLAVSGALIYSLGVHETVYAVVFGIGFLGILVAGWVVQSVRTRRLAPGPSGPTMVGLGAAAVLTLAIFSATCLGIAKEQGPDGLWSVLRYRLFVDMTLDDVELELTEPDANRLLQWKSTFYAGRYLTGYGSYHANTFLYHGPGFNGIVPLFVYPGFLVGLWGFGRALIRLVRPGGSPPCDRSQRYFLIFNLVLLIVFGLVALTSSDPKPTRCTCCMFAVFALSAQGYQQLYGLIRRFVAARQWAFIPLIASRRQFAARVAAAALLLVVGGLMSLRLHKNHADLHRYLARYLREIPTDGLLPLLEQARTEHAAKQVYFLNGFVAHAWHPAIGLLTGWNVPENVTFVNPHVWKQPLPADAVVFVRERSEWRTGDAADLGK